MFRRYVMVLGGAAVLAFSTAQLRAAIIPPNLPPGSQYELAFVTSGTTNAESSDISYYNDFVTGQAAPLTPILPPGVTWHAIASTQTVIVTQGMYIVTSTVRANVNAPRTLGIPIYNTLGQLVTLNEGFDQLYGSYFGLSNPILRLDGALPTTMVWTGSNPSGDPGSKVIAGYGGIPAALGSTGAPGGPVTGSPWEYGSDAWITNTWNVTVDTLLPIYGLSSPITIPVPEPPPPPPPPNPIPEPSTLIVWSLLGASGVGFGWWRRKRGA